jgi:hypothetical protein
VKYITIFIYVLQTKLRKARKRHLQLDNLKWAHKIAENTKTLMAIWCAKHGPEKAQSMMSAEIRDAGMEQYLHVVVAPTT